MSKQPLTRRDFLADPGKTAATLAANPVRLTVPRRARPQVPGEPIVHALIRPGGPAAGHASALSRVAGVEFKCGCDVWQDRGAPAS